MRYKHVRHICVTKRNYVPYGYLSFGHWELIVPCVALRKRRKRMDERTLAGFRKFLEVRLRGLLSGRYGPDSEPAYTGQVDPMDSADLASSHCDKELLNTFRYRNQQLVEEISLAIQRIDAGEFGICCVCSNSIGLERLQAQPTALLCIRCQGLVETLRRRLPAA